MAVKGKGKEVASNPSSSKRPRNGPAGGSSSSAAAGKKKRRSGALKFVDDAAYVAEDDEEEDDLDDEEDYADFWEEIANEGRDAVNETKEKGKAVIDDPKPKEKSFIPFIVKEEELSGDELEELIRERYGRGSGLRHADYEDHDIGGPDPTKDPTVWRLKTGVGRERQVVFCFMQKYVDFHNRGNKLQIFSAFSLDHVKGFVYVEADKVSDVMEACKGFTYVYPSRITAVPTNEAPLLLAVRNKPNLLSKGTWVRLKTGNYKGDIAQVVSVDDAKKKVMIKLVPRIDLHAISKKFGGAISLKNAEIPHARLINPRELEVFRPHIEPKRDRETGEVFEVLDGNMLKNGYLFKRVALTSLIYWGVEPTESEKNKFRDIESEEGAELEGWVDNLYDRKKKKKMRETGGSGSGSAGADLKASSSAQVDDDDEDEGFGVHDLVLFGKKDFGVFLGKEKDGSCKILKGDTEKSTVVAVKRSEIKKVCSDKMFTALDKNKKNISINDPVDVSVGPTEGKKGVVKHMYRGVLFIHSEDETENSGYFCAKSEHCESTKKPKELPEQSFGENMDDNSAPFFPPPSPSPFQSFDQQDNNPRERRRPERESPFSIGQTLRIRKGPLKGYLCRVVRMWRNDVTVKLDSLVKTITVNVEHLSVPTKKGQTDGSGAAATTDLFGDQGAQDGGSSWDTGLPSITSDTWQPFGSSATQTTENTAGGDDPWGSKLPSTSAADPWNTDKPSDAWAQPTVASTQTATWQRDDDSNRTTTDDPWGSIDKGKTIVSEEPSGWGNTVKNTETDDPWGNNDKGKAVVSEESSGWGNTTETVKSVQVDNDPWGSAVSKDPVESDAWGSKGKIVVSDELPSVKTDSWDTKGKGIATSNEADAWGQAKEKTEGGETGGWGSKTTGASTQNDEDNSAWGKLTNTHKNQETDNAWGSKSDDNAWGKTKEQTEGGGNGGWGSGGGNASWDKPNSSSWNKGGGDEGDNNNNNNQRNSWNSGGGFEGGRGRGRGGGRGGGRWRDRDGGESGGSFRGRGGGRFGGRGGRGDRDSDKFGGSSWNGDKGGEDSTWGRNSGGWSNSSGGGEKKTDWGSSSWSTPAPAAADGTQGGADPWGDKLGSATGTDTKNDTWGTKAEDKTKESDTWGSKPTSGDGTGDKADAWGAKATTESKESNPWGAAKTTETETQTGGWNTVGSSSQSQTDTWGKSGNDSDWSKPRFDLTGGDNNNNNEESGYRPRWNNSDGGGRGRGRGRGRNYGDRDGGNSENWRGGDRDSNGGRGNWRGRGGGRFGGGRGGGGRDGGGGSWNRDENSSSFGGGSWNRDENKSSFGGGSWNSGGGSSSWAAGQGSSWGKSDGGEKNNGNNNNNNGGGGWNEKKSTDWGGSSWGTEKNSSEGGDKEKGNNNNNNGWDNEKDKGSVSAWNGGSDGKDKGSASTWNQGSDEKDKGSAAGWNQDSDEKDKKIDLNQGSNEREKGSGSGWGEGGLDEKDKGSAWGREEEKGKNEGANDTWDNKLSGGDGGSSTGGW
ncbi:hypothetical protein LUZ60_001475 [Juncus effusus]|nr:hypothetical protein LUZ60_001475 [Juncus effusus]